MYEEYLRWSSVKASLLANGFSDDSTLRKLDVHYRFLSAFVHPYTNVAPLLYGRNTWDWPAYDHYSSELILLYIVVFAVEELRALEAMTRRRPTVQLEGWGSISAKCDEAWQASSHLWFPGQEPHAYDRHRESNSRGFRAHLEDMDEVVVDPATLSADDVRYYAHPLLRLVAMHMSVSELFTNLTYNSPWPRVDAHRR